MLLKHFAVSSLATRPPVRRRRFSTQFHGSQVQPELVTLKNLEFSESFTHSGITADIISGYPNSAPFVTILQFDQFPMSNIPSPSLQTSSLAFIDPLYFDIFN